MELLRNDKERANYLLNYHSRLILVPATYLMYNHEELISSKIKIDSLVVMEANQLLDFESFAAVTICKRAVRIVMLGDDR